MNRRLERARELRQRVDADTAREWWRRGFATFLVLALAVGLYLSFRPAGFKEMPDLASDDASQAPAEPAEQEDPDPPQEQDPVDEEPEEEEEEPELTEAQIEELIDAARDPAETSVQVLDAGGGATAASDVADVLADLGYDVVAINPSRVNYDVTTVLFTSGNDAEAEALRARDDRFAETAPNERLSEGVDLHVVVGSDWSG